MRNSQTEEGLFSEDACFRKGLQAMTDRRDLYDKALDTYTHTHTHTRYLVGVTHADIMATVTKMHSHRFMMTFFLFPITAV